MMVILDSNNSPKFPLFIILVDLDGVLASMVWGAHAVSKRTLIGVTDLQPKKKKLRKVLGICDSWLKKYSSIELGG